MKPSLSIKNVFLLLGYWILFFKNIEYPNFILIITYLVCILVALLVLAPNFIFKPFVLKIRVVPHARIRC